MVRIYLVEDDEVLQQLYQLYLSKMGHRIVGQSTNGIEALIDLYFNHRNNPPDILILDYKLPGKNGLELLEDLHKLDAIKQTKILFVTGMDNLQLQAFKLGVSKYIQKPLSFNILNQTISEIVSLISKS